jgi:hypothetical protein
MSQLSDTARIIMEIFGESNLKMNRAFKVMDLIINKSLLNSRHQVKFSVAVHELIEVEYLKWGQEAELILTERGYKALNN